MTSENILHLSFSGICLSQFQVLDWSINAKAISYANTKYVKICKSITLRKCKICKNRQMQKRDVDEGTLRVLFSVLSIVLSSVLSSVFSCVLSCILSMILSRVLSGVYSGVLFGGLSCVLSPSQ